MSITAEHAAAAVRIRRYRGFADCDVIVAVRGQEMSLRFRNYSEAVKWARIECKSYGIESGFTVAS
jgi:hypothetical protein